MRLIFAATAVAVAIAESAEKRVVRTQLGDLEGSCVDGSCRFVGIPFAEAPVGPLRWKPPVAVTTEWDGIRDASQWGSNCLQLIYDEYGNATAIGDEDCLFLNVYAPPACLAAASEKEGTSSSSSGEPSCAVMFWVHGGSYINGGTAPFTEVGEQSSQWNGSNFNAIADDVIVVTTNYRLNVFGFLGSTQLTPRDTESGSTGNYGIQDQRMAMEWVQDNIARFGGDKDNVMLFGESAGAGSVSMHLTMEKSFPNYNKVGIESGAFSYWSAVPMYEAQAQYDDLVVASSCKDGAATSDDEALACLLELDAESLAVVAGLNASLVRPYGCPYAPVVDGVELGAFPWDLRTQGKFNTEVPVLVGFNKDEGTIDVSLNPAYANGINMTEVDFDENLLLNGIVGDNATWAHSIYGVGSAGVDPDDYTNWYWSSTHLGGDYAFSCPTMRTVADLLAYSTHADEIYLYYFAHAPLGPAYSWAGIPGEDGTGGASHASELTFVWQVEDTSLAQYLVSDDERALAYTMATYWVNFARSSDPNVGPSSDMAIHWAPYSEDTGEHNLRFDLPSLTDVEGNQLVAQCEYIDQLGVVAPETGAASALAAPLV